MNRDSGSTMLLTPVLLLFASSLRIICAADWCYQSQVSCSHTCTGPAEWGSVSRLCSGAAQSPVNIVTKRALHHQRLTTFHFTGHQDTFHGNLSNTGHYVQLDLPPSIKVDGGDLAASYRALQFHLHWGSDGGPGSEHTVDGERFPMEMHVVHIKEEYDSLSQALTDAAGVAVLGFFFQESQSANKKYVPLIDALKSITGPTNSTTLEGVSLDMFIPPQENMTRYFRYKGSLTTPGCEEAVVWSLFENPVPLSREQLAAFSDLRFSDGEQMVGTYRPVQPLNGRQVFYSRGHVAVVSSVSLVSSVLLPLLSGIHTAAGVTIINM